MLALLHSVPPTLHPATADPRLHQRLWTLTGKFGSVLLSSESCEQGSVWSLQESVSPVQCKFWWLCGVVNGDLFQEGLCHPQLCCTQSFYPCSSPLLTGTSTGNTQTQFCLSLYGVSGSWCALGLFWALWVSLASIGFDSKCDFARPTVLLWFLCPWMWGISSQLLQHRATSAPALRSSCSLCLSLGPESSKYVSFDTREFLYIPGQYNLVFNVSFILNLHISLENWIPYYILLLWIQLLYLSWFTFSIVLFSDFSGLVGLMFSHYFLTWSCLFHFYTLDQIATMAWNICFYIFTYVYPFGLQCLT